MTEQGFKIKSEKFEGPIELLLNLMEKRKLHPSDISLAEVADDYISYVQSADNLPVDETANFLVIASTLLLIKSRSLLPDLSISEEEALSIADLEERLKIYQEIRGKSRLISNMYGQRTMFARQPSNESIVVFAPSQDLSISSIVSAIKEVIVRFPKAEVLPKIIVAKVVSLEETISNLADRVTQHMKTSFKEFSGGVGGDKVGVIITFLAMLELVKQGVIAVTQHSHFADIEMESRQTSKTPNYT